MFLAPKDHVYHENQRPFKHSALLSDFDDVVRMCLSDIIGYTLREKEWHQAKHPVSTGGSGLGSAHKHAPAAHVSCVVPSTDLVIRICRSESVTNTPLMSAIKLFNGETN